MVFADGSVANISMFIKPKILHALWTSNNADIPGD